MKCRYFRIINIACLVLLSVLVIPAGAQDDSDCEPEAVAEWMVQRMVGINRFSLTFDQDPPLSALDQMLVIQEIRRDLEDLPRPTCADELYILTIRVYDSVVDADALYIANRRSEGDAIFSERGQVYAQSMPVIFQELEDIAGIDVVAAADEIVAVPTLSPTTEPNIGDSRNNPVLFGETQTIHISDYVYDYFSGAITVTGFNGQANERVAAENQFNVPSAGMRYIVVEITMSCDRKTDETCTFEQRNFRVVGSSGVIREHTFVVGFDTGIDFFGGTELTVEIPFEVGVEETGFVLIAGAEYGEETVFFAIGE